MWRRARRVWLLLCLTEYDEKATLQVYAVYVFHWYKSTNTDAAC